jgi:hypothetical protein
MKLNANWLCGCESEMTEAELRVWETVRLMRQVLHDCPRHGYTSLAWCTSASTPFPNKR